MNKKLHPAKVRSVIGAAQAWTINSNNANDLANKIEQENLFANATVPTTLRQYAANDHATATRILAQLDVNLSG